MTHRALAAARFALVACMALLAGCSFNRNEKSRAIAPPQDPVRVKIQASVNELLRSAEMQLGTAQQYYIGPGDVLSISLVGRPDILGEQVTQTGEVRRFNITVTEFPYVTLPLVGAVKVHGRTVEQLTDDLKAAYASFITNPVPVVSIEKFFYNQVAVLGSVREPGRYPLDFGDTVVDAIFKAGGLTFGRETGGLPPARFMKIYREKVSKRQKTELSPDALLELLKEDDKILPRKEIVIPIEEFILNGELSYNIPLQPNDVVFIPSAGTVSMQGRLVEPGVCFLGPSIRTLTQAITERGGMRYGANSKVELVRTLPDGTQQTFFFNARQMLKRREPDFILQDGDQVFVFMHPWRNFFEELGKIVRTSAQTGVNATYRPI